MQLEEMRGKNIHLIFVSILFYGAFMTREEFEAMLKDFEVQVKKRLPSMINTYLVNKGNREYEASFKHLLDTLQRQRKELLKNVSKVARHEGKIKYFNTVYNMDSQLRSMEHKDAFQQHLKFRHKRTEAPVVYDIGFGPEQGNLLNAEDHSLLLKTQEKVASNKDVSISISGKTAHGKAVWSVKDVSGSAETEVRITEAPDEFLKEMKGKLKDEG
jgi:hypothetical protein